MIRFLKAELIDAAAINDITHKAFKLYAAEVGPHSHIKALEEPESAVLNDIANNCVFVAKDDDGKILGSVRIKGISRELAYLYRFGVNPNVRNGGVGSGLL